MLSFECMNCGLVLYAQDMFSLFGKGIEHRCRVLIRGKRK